MKDRKIYFPIILLLAANCASPQRIFSSNLSLQNFHCIGEPPISHKMNLGKVWETRYTCATTNGPAVPIGAYLLEVKDPAAHNEGIEGETKITIGKKCIVSVIYMGLNYEKRPYRNETVAIMKLFANRAKNSFYCR